MISVFMQRKKEKNTNKIYIFFYMTREGEGSIGLIVQRPNKVDVVVAGSNDDDDGDCGGDGAACSAVLVVVVVVFGWCVT